MLVDTHCHLTSPEFAGDIDRLLAAAREAGVARIISIATTPTDAQQVMSRFEAEPGVFLVAGIHPHQAGDANADSLAALREIHQRRQSAVGTAWTDRIVGVGETGLDFHYDFAPRDVQERVVRIQLELALACRRSVVIHARKAEERVVDILSDYPALAERTVFHCYSGGPEITRRILDRGHWLSFTGVVTFKNAEDIRAAARHCPDDRIMVETDAPYLTPEPHRRIWPNEPRYVAVTARYIAELRGQPYADFARLTTQNAERFFGLPKESG